MKIERWQISIRDLVAGFQDNGDKGVFGYNGKLNIRPPYQREFVYPSDKQEAVIQSVRRNFPLNVMYWAKIDGQDAFEILDGQQRTISIARFAKKAGGFHIKDPLRNGDIQYFYNWDQDEQDAFLDYPLDIYVCEGTGHEKIEWFKTINIAGMALTPQELRNAVFSGTWTADAKSKFSGHDPDAFRIMEGRAKDYMSGKPLRQEILETAIDWISPGKIDEYMAKNQRSPDADELWQHFQQVIAWVSRIFPHPRKDLMRKVDWGRLHRTFAGNSYNSTALGVELKALLSNEDITDYSGVYEYLLELPDPKTGLRPKQCEKVLSIRAFSPSMRQFAFNKQGGLCVSCQNIFDIEGMEADHIIPWSKGGPTAAENCQMLCKKCNNTKSNK